MPILGKAALAVWLECLPEAEEDFNRWYWEEHLSERVSLPGFIRGRRYQAVRGGPKYFAFYEGRGLHVFRSPPYLRRLNHPSEWTRRVMPTVRNFTRGVYSRCQTMTGGGHAAGARAVLTLRLDPYAGGQDAVRARYEEAALRAMTEISGVVSATLFEADASAPGGTTVERSLIGATAEAPLFFCLCELEDPAVADRPAWQALLAADGLARSEAISRLTEGVYRLLHSCGHASAD